LTDVQRNPLDFSGAARPHRPLSSAPGSRGKPEQLPVRLSKFLIFDHGHVSRGCSDTPALARQAGLSHSCNWRPHGPSGQNFETLPGAYVEHLVALLPKPARGDLFRAGPEGRPLARPTTGNTEEPKTRSEDAESRLFTQTIEGLLAFFCFLRIRGRIPKPGPVAEQLLLSRSCLSSSATL